MVSYCAGRWSVTRELLILLSTPFWDKKVKIAILTLATFAALC